MSDIKEEKKKKEKKQTTNAASPPKKKQLVQLKLNALKVTTEDQSTSDVNTKINNINPKRK